MTKFSSLKENYTKALARFSEILKEPKSDIVRDSAIKRFEIVFDLGWKTLKAFLEENHNSNCVSPQSCYREAFRVGIIDYDNAWLEMAKLRNLTVHTYNEQLSDTIYSRLTGMLQKFQQLAVIFSTNEQRSE